MATAYHIPDEPRPGTLANMTVNPFWPLLCVMFVGSGLSWAWFVFNGIAMGSPTRRRELGIALGGLLGNLVLLLGASLIYGRLGADGSPALPYLLLVGTVWRLAVCYVLYTMQASSFGIYEYYDGVVQNGWIGLIGAMVLWRALLVPMLGGVPLLLPVLS